MSFPASNIHFVFPRFKVSSLGSQEISPAWTVALHSCATPAKARLVMMAAAYRTEERHCFCNNC